MRMHDAIRNGRIPLTRYACELHNRRAYARRKLARCDNKVRRISFENMYVRMRGISSPTIIVTDRGKHFVLNVPGHEFVYCHRFLLIRRCDDLSVTREVSQEQLRELVDKWCGNVNA